MNIPGARSALISPAAPQVGRAHAGAGMVARAAGGESRDTAGLDTPFALDASAVDHALAEAELQPGDAGATATDLQHVALYTLYTTTQPLLPSAAARDSGQAMNTHVDLPLAKADTQALPSAVAPSMPAVGQLTEPPTVPQAQAMPAPVSLATKADGSLPPPRMVSAAGALDLPGLSQPQVVAGTASLHPALRAAQVPPALADAPAPLADRAPRQPAAGALAPTITASPPAPFDGGAPVRPSPTVTIEPQSKLVALLGERISVHAEQGIHRAVIRLDPLMSGTVTIELRHEAGAIQIHLSATNRDVVRQLQAIGENLRHDLANRQFTDVAVHVSGPRTSDPGGDGRQQRDGQDQHAPREPRPGRALAEEDFADTAFQLAAHHATQSDH